MDKQASINSWILHAKADLINAEDAASKTYPVHEGIVCFHCQQSAEKWLKAYLLFKDVEFKYIHDLTKHLELCESVEPSFSKILIQCNALNKYSITPRYPAEWDITESEMKTALQYAKEVQAFVEPLIIK